ncbi:MAG: DUF4430 domain-containing protein [Oscillospiraceae bacterium]|nr:DUF4430 domain-containing protein [Oscillospiraceae bacterium]
MKKSLKSSKIIAIVLAITMMFALLVPGFSASAADFDGYVAISVDAGSVGAGLLYAPQLVGFYAGESVADITVRFVGAGNLDVTNHQLYGWSLQGFKIPVSFTPALPADLAACIDYYTEMLDDTDEPELLNTSGPSTAGQFLRDYDFFDLDFTSWGMWRMGSGWMFTVNNQTTEEGAAATFPKDGDVIRWQFSLFWGDDIGMGWDMVWNNTPRANKDALTMAVARVNSSPNKAQILSSPAAQSAYNAALASLGNLSASQNAVTSALSTLNSATGGGFTNIGGGIFAQFIDFFRRIIDWILNIFRWN